MAKICCHISLDVVPIRAIVFDEICLYYTCGQSEVFIYLVIIGG